MRKTTPILRKFLMVCATFLTLTIQAQISLTATSGTLSGNYTTIKAAFDAINAGTHQGDIFISVTGNTTETATAVLNANGSGSASYLSLFIQADGGAARTISGSLSGSIITLNGADGVSINGVNAGGNSLTIENSNNATSSSAILFTNGATNNTVNNCYLKGSNSSTTTYTHGVVTFSSGTNSGNQITNCDIGPSGSNKPSRCIVSGAGTNTNITIDNCQIHDFSGGAGTGINDRHSAIYLYYGTTSGWTITNNHIYQTSSNTLVTEGIISIIYVRSGDGYTISNNFIGGSTSNCGGTAMTYDGNIKEFYVIEMGSDVGYTNISTIDNNTIKNISFNSTSTSSSTNNSVPRFSTIQIRRGKVTINRNTIGSTTENGNISLSQGNTTFSLYYFLVPLAYSNYVVNVTNCNYNTIAGISLSATNFDAYGVHMEPYVGNSIDSFCYNQIGSLTQSNSIEIARLTSSVTRNYFAAIFASSIVLGEKVMKGNTVANITRGSSSGTNQMKGIYSFMDSALIIENTVMNLSSGGTGSIYGIHAMYSPDQTIGGNYVSGLGCTGSTTNMVYGICNEYSGSNGPIFNNIVVLGTDGDGNTYADCPFAGIGHRYSSNVYFNTVYINGTTTGKNSYAYYEYFNSSSREIKNNIFVNARSNSSGTAKHYAASFYSTAGLTSDYNDYFVSGTGGTLAYLSGDHTTLVDVRNATTQDANSYDLNPNFTSPGSTNALDYRIKSGLLGTSIAGISEDYSHITRGTTPTIGALDGYYWRGATDTDFATASNWIGGSVPPDNAYIFFDQAPVNNCVLDANHIIGGLINEQGSYGLDLNGFELDLKGELILDGGAWLDARTSGSKFILSGSEPQEIPASAFSGNTIYALEVNNDSGVIINDNDTIVNELNMLSGDIDLNGNTLVIGSSTSNTGSLNHTSGRIIGTLSRWYAASTNSGSVSGLFPLGYGDKDRFVTVEYATAPTTGGTLTATFNPVSMGQSGLPLINVAAAGACSPFDITNTSDEGYWIMTPGNSLTDGTYDITLVGEGFHDINQLCDLSAIKRVGGSPWFESGVHEETTGTLSRPVVKRSGASGWSNWGFGGGTVNPLPVKILTLELNCEAGVVVFKTAEEKQGLRFELQISMDGRNWQSAGTVQSENQRFSSYEFNVKGLELNYFRIAELNHEGKATYSDIKTANCGTSNAYLSVYPNPVNDMIHINGLSSTGTIEIYNASGVKVLSFENESESLSIQTAGLPSGMYLIRYNDVNIKFIKQ